MKKVEKRKVPFGDGIAIVDQITITILFAINEFDECVYIGSGKGIDMEEEHIIDGSFMEDCLDNLDEIPKANGIYKGDVTGYYNMDMWEDVKLQNVELIATSAEILLT